MSRYVGAAISSLTRADDHQKADFSQIPISAIFVIHDAGLDWALAIQVITELLQSDGGRMGTRRPNAAFGKSNPDQMPIVLTNPDLIWGRQVLRPCMQAHCSFISDYPLPRLGMGAFRSALSTIYKAGRLLSTVPLG